MPDKGGTRSDFLGSVGVLCSPTAVGGGRVVLGLGGGRVVLGLGGGRSGNEGGNEGIGCSPGPSGCLPRL